MSKIEVVGLGALNMDYIYYVERILADGETAVTDAVKYSGGSAANTIYGLARLGIKTGFIGAVGDDSDGQTLIEDFREAGVDTSWIKVVSGAKTGSVLCLSDGQQRALYVSPGANNQLSLTDVDTDYIKQARILHVSSFVADRQFKVLLELIGRLDAAIKLSFAPGALYAARGLTALGQVLARTDVLFVNRDELRQLTGQGVIAGAAIFLDRGCRMVAVTLGRGTTLEIANGDRVEATAYIRDTANEYVVEPRGTVREIDTTGAGDAFTAGFLYGWLKGQPALDCGRLGDIAARSCLERNGARDGLPTRDWLSRSYQQLYGEIL